MTRSLFRHVAGLVAGAAVALFLGTAPAQGASLTFNDPNCAAFSVTGTAPNFNLVCQTLACSISASPANPTPGQQVTLTGSCAGGGTATYTWTSLTTSNANCPAPSSSSGASVTVTPPSTTTEQTCAYRVNGTDGTLSGTATASVPWSNAPVLPPSGCTLTANPTSLPATGGSVTLAVTCTGGATPTSYAWTSAPANNPTLQATTTAGTQPAPVTVSATTTFYVTPSNAGGPATQPAQTTVAVGAAPPPPGTACTINGVSYAMIDMGQLPFTTNVNTTTFGGGKVAVASMVIPSGVSSTTSVLQIFDWGSVTYRKAWLSKSRCDTPGWTSPTGNATRPASQNVTFYYTIGGTDPNAVIMQPGEIWYLMVVNQNLFGQNSCNGTCNVGVTWSRPN